MSHVPVLIHEVLSALSPCDGELYLDGTFGAGGYTAAILSAANCNVIGLDRDPNVERFVGGVREKFPKRFEFVRAQFSKLDEVVESRLLDGVILDIGVSSMQIDEGARGFSFMRDGALDMRMSGEGASAADAVNHLKHNELIQIFKVYGEERRARRCADFIARAREQEPIKTTGALAQIISSALGRSGKNHPATRVFQALRIYINDELGELHRGLLAAEAVLKPGGRLVVVTFHSLEDRIVKSFFRERSEKTGGGSRYSPPQEASVQAPSFLLEKRSGVGASKEEDALNPRSRSARLRFGARTQAEPWPANDDVLPNAPSLDVLNARLS